jgi:TolA-binding protein
MNRPILRIVLASLFTLSLLFACSDQKEPAKSETKVTSREVKQEAKEAVETAKAYTYQQKDEYLSLMKAKMEDLDRQIQELQAKAESKASEVKTQSQAEFNQAMEELRSKKKAAEAKYESLKSASAEAWNDMRSGMDSAMDEMSAAFKRARASFDK